MTTPEPSQAQPAAPTNGNDPALQSTDSERLVFFSDAVIAIAITLLVLDIHVPRVADLMAGNVSLVQALLDQWPSYLSYAIGFIIIGEMWSIHHFLFRYIKRTNQSLMYLNIFLLLCIAFIPFATGLLAEYAERPEQRIVACVFGITLTMCCVFFSIIWWYVTRNQALLDPQLDAPTIKRIAQFSRSLVLLYAVATLIALVSAPVAIGLYVLFVTMILVPHPGPGPRAQTAPRAKAKR